MDFGFTLGVLGKTLLYVTIKVSFRVAREDIIYFVSLFYLLNSCNQSFLWHQFLKNIVTKWSRLEVEKDGPMPRLVSVRGLIQNFQRASPPLSYGSLPGPCTRIYIACIWSRHLKLYWRKWSLIQMSLMKHLLYNLNWSFSKHTVACANITMLCCVTAICLRKIMDKSVMG